MSISQRLYILKIRFERSATFNGKHHQKRDTKIVTKNLTCHLGLNWGRGLLGSVIPLIYNVCDVCAMYRIMILSAIHR